MKNKLRVLNQFKPLPFFTQDKYANRYRFDEDWEAAKMYFSQQVEIYFQEIFNSSNNNILNWTDTNGRFRSKQCDFVLPELKTVGEIKVNFIGSKKSILRSYKDARQQKKGIQYPLDRISFSYSIIIVSFGDLAFFNTGSTLHEVSYVSGEIILSEMLKMGLVDAHCFDYLIKKLSCNETNK